MLANTIALITKEQWRSKRELFLLTYRVGWPSVDELVTLPHEDQVKPLE